MTSELIQAIRDGRFDGRFDEVYDALRARQAYLNTAAALDMPEGTRVLTEADVRPRHRARKWATVMGPAKKAGYVTLIFDDRSHERWTWPADRLIVDDRSEALR